MGEAFAIDLPSTPGTGYRWESEPVSGDIELLEHGWDVPADAQPGGSSVQRFRFVAHSPGRHPLTFILKRSWESKGVDTTTVEVYVE